MPDSLPPLKEQHRRTALLTALRRDDVKKNKGQHRPMWFKDKDRRRAMIIRLAEAQNWRCCWCGTPMDYPLRNESGMHKPHMAASLEHVLPSTWGGASNWHNTAAAHARCNTAAGVVAYSMLADALHQLLELRLPGLYMVEGK